MSHTDVEKDDLEVEDEEEDSQGKEEGGIDLTRPGYR